MILRSLVTRLAIIGSILCAFAFAGDDDAFYFSLSSEQIYYPGSPETAIQFSGNGVGGAKVYMRAFRINDPVEFFLAQKDPHAPSLLAMKEANTFDMIEQSFSKVKRDARYAARDVMPADARRAIRDVADLNSSKAEKERQKNQKPTPTDRTKLVVDDIPKGAEHFDIVATWEHQLTIKPGEEENWHYEGIPVPIKEKGVYLVEARIRGKRAMTTVVISELGMVVKQSNTEILSYVVNSRTGERVGDVELVVARGGKRLAEKSTGADGTMRIAVPAPEQPTRTSSDWDEEDWRWEYRNRMVLVVGEKAGNMVISDPYFYSYGNGDNKKFYLHTDRSVYRPGHTVYYRGIARTVNEDGTYAQPAASDRVVVMIEDSRGDLVRRDTLAVSAMGTFNAQFVLAEEPPLGTWSIMVSRIGAGEYDGQWFNFGVEEYKKPEYKVVVTTDRTNYTRGDQIKAMVKADYYFGSPVANAEVEYFVYRAQYWRPWWRGSDWAYLYEDGDDDYSTYRMEMVSSGKGLLNPDGTFAINYKTNDTASRDYVYRIQANVVDNSRRSIAGARSVEVTRGEFYISTSTDKYVYKPGDEAKLRVNIATFDGDRPVATALTVRTVHTWWDRKKNDSLEGGWEYVPRSEQTWSGTGTTGADGSGTVPFTPSKPGYFMVEVSARDSRGTTITESNYFYVADPAYANWYREGSSDVQIIPDKPAYKPGETMSALVIMPSPNVDALVTIEGSTIYSAQVEHLNGTSAIVRIPIEERFAPSVYLGASAMVNEELFSETQRISVVPEGKLLHLEVTPDKQTYRPGERGTVSVRATDERGAPVQNVDVALAVVDESVFAIRPDNTPDIQRFFYSSRWNEVMTSSSLNFSFYGEATRIDKDATDALYGYHMRGGNESQESRPGDGRNSRFLAFGDVKGDMFVQPVTRKNFKDMMFWTPSAMTDADGRATMNLEFPDNLTTWRITARGVTANTAVGQATARVVARKELLVRMETPRFLIQGDELLVATTVHNYLSSAKSTKVQLTGENITATEGEQTVTIPANGEKRIDWKVSAKYTGSAALTVKALTNEESDAMQLVVPVMPRGMKLATGSVTQLDAATNARALNLMLPTGAEPGSARITMTFAPSLAGALLGSLDSLIGYPYGCVEQTMSRFLPTVVVADALHKLDLPFDAKRRAEIPKMVGKGLAKLYGMQHEDGGWGWWEHDKTDAFMTAYVVYGLTLAQRAGYQVNAERYGNGVDALAKLLATAKRADGRRMNATSEAYIAYVLSVVNKGKPQKDLADRIKGLASRDSLNAYARALVSLASTYQNMRQLAGEQLTRLEKVATVGPEYAYWQPAGMRYYWENDAVEASAYAVRAILELKGETPLASKAIQWLLMQRNGDGWSNTRQTAMVIYALIDQIKSSGQLTPDYTVNVRVNGKPAFSRHIGPEDVFAPEIRARIDASGLVNGNNAVTIEKIGTGKLYTSARMVYYATGPALRPASAGFTVSREYFRLRKERRGEVIVYTKEPLRGPVATGDVLFVKVKMTPDRPYEYVMVEDPLPAGCEVVENTDGYTIAGEAEYDESARKQRNWWSWDWWYADRDVRDEKVSFFAREVGASVHEFSYVMRAQIPGTYSIMPSMAMLMYYTDVRGNSDAMNLTITP